MQPLSRRSALRGGTAAALAATLPSNIIEAKESDPVIGLVADWYEARRASDEHYAEINAMLERLPEDVKNWQGADGGWQQDSHGRMRRTFLFSESSIRAYFDLRVPDRDFGQDRIDQERDRAIEEFRAMKSREREAYRVAGVPYAPDEIDEYWEREHYERIDEIEDAILATPAKTVAGLHAKLRFTVDFMHILHGDAERVIAEKELDFDQRVILRIVEDLDRLEGGAS